MINKASTFTGKLSNLECQKFVTKGYQIKKNIKSKSVIVNLNMFQS